jgi:replicative DNA helicase
MTRMGVNTRPEADNWLTSDPVQAGSRVPPHNADLEFGLVGAALVWPDRLEKLAADLAPEDFYTPRWGHAWAAWQRLMAEGVKPDVSLVADRAAWVEVGDLVSAMANAVSPQRAHVEVILRHAAARRVISLAGEIAEIGYEAAGDFGDHLDGLVGALRKEADCLKCLTPMGGPW